VQGSAEWLAYRRGRIGASEAAAVLGIDPWTTPLMLFNKKLSGEEFQGNEDTRRGHELEPFVRRMISEQYFRKYEPVVIENPKYNFAFASLDGWDADADIPLMEIKCPRKHSHVLPDHHLMQLQWQMMVSEAKEAIYVSYDGQEIVELIVKRDDLLIEKLAEAGKAFYNRLGSFDPPDPIDGRDIVVLDDPEAVNEANEYERACFEEKMATDKKEKLREKLIERAAGRSIKAGDLKITKVIRKGNVDYSSIPALQNLDLELYRKPPTTQWRLS